MKKLLTLLGSVTLIATTSAAVIACGGTRSEQKVTEDKKDDKTEKTKEEKKEFKSVLSDQAKKEISNVVKTILTEVVDHTESGEKEIINSKDDISNEFAFLLDQILNEKHNNVDESLNFFKNELIEFSSPFFVGDLLGKFPKLKEENKELLNKLVWTSEINIDNKAQDIVGIVFDKNEDFEIDPTKVVSEFSDEDQKMIEDILSEYKQYITEYANLFEEETKEQFKKLKEIVEKDIKK
ncbi:lipoprotein [Mycoplasma capricolum]|uniref:lipoprotein n=1 Tax=Mycoplasma capricolum TaxID=2095 RepID=UPI000629F7ED|nr:lipoprotein [Mycoplasma capricolum]KKW61393.1 putative antigen 332 [Mycoplasma capricolum subsp. capricolum]